MYITKNEGDDFVVEEVFLKDLKGTAISGIYKLVFPNGKIYIGQAQNIYKRVSEHNQRAACGQHGNRDIQICEKAIQKYGKIDYFLILERVDDLSELDKKEQYWIRRYDSSNRDKGYNVLAGKDVSQVRGLDHPNALFSKEDLNDIIDLLQNHLDIPIIAIAEKYNVNQMTIHRICQGISYTNPNLHYPLRDTSKRDFAKKDKIADYFDSEESLIELKEALKNNWWESLEIDIPKHYNIPKRIVRQINYGEKFAEIGKYEYPIRKKNTVRNVNNFTKQDVLDILDLLKNTDLTMIEIGRKYNIHRQTVSNINKGISFPIKDYIYPARDTKK